ncbi:MAG: translation initiation factor IF-2 subunit alpha [Thermoplasmata archaeon]|nr:MAG: translation initiation factor IF-2 subunit alpha [Thermoplasmata archaeon]RLF74159.1 MAG: translation initiation factor IF-2 subunit alpha [Thermoplasmata archaeon]HDD59400.1 translation initiation factor IF-2 subunit alpha [Euryarchaeota archaeon]
MVSPVEQIEEGELVIGTVKKVKNFGAFVNLDEYPGVEGFIHIAEVSSGWVKYIRDFIREGQKVVCKVLSVDPNKRYVELSLKQVNEHQRREKIQQWKNEQKARKLMELLAEELNTTSDALMEEFGWNLVEEFGSLYTAMEQASANEEVIRSKYSGVWVEPFLKIVRDNVVPPFVVISGNITLSIKDPRGIEYIKRALEEGEKTGKKHTPEGVDVEIKYQGAPNYLVRVRAPDYKTAESVIQEVAESVIGTIRKAGGEGCYTKKK